MIPNDPVLVFKNRHDVADCFSASLDESTKLDPSKIEILSSGTNRNQTKSVIGRALALNS